MQLYNLSTPETARIPLVVSLPHSGTCVPSEVDDQFDAETVPALAPVDWHLDKIYDFLPELGITVIQATHSRYVVNLNRALTEPLFGPESTCAVPDMTCFRKPLYNNHPSRAQVEQRIEKYYHPYHRELSGIVKGFLEEFGCVYLLDLHSSWRIFTWNSCIDFNCFACLNYTNKGSCQHNYK